jgi:hypothetical protein
MSNTRRTVYDATEAGGSAAGNENRDPPPPPPPPYTAEQFWKHLGPGVGFGNWWQRIITMTNVWFAETLVS